MRLSFVLVAFLVVTPAAAQTPTPDAGADADADAGIQERPNTRKPGDPSEPDALPWVIPKGKEGEITPLFTGIWDQPPAGVTPGGISVERNVVRLKLTLDTRPAELLLVHPTDTEPQPNEVFRKGGEAEKLFVVGVCNGCNDAERQRLGALGDVVLAHQRARSAELWVYKEPPAPRPPQGGPQGGPQQPQVGAGQPAPGPGVEGQPSTEPRTSLPVARLIRIVIAIALVVALTVLLRRRNEPPEPPAPPSGS